MKQGKRLSIPQDASLDSVLCHMNEALAPVAEDLQKRLREPEHPTVIIVGVPRSGTTLLEQLIIQRYSLGYVSNLIARFWLAPALGALLQKSVSGTLVSPEVAFESRLGLTQGYEGAHEFGFFWRRWLSDGDAVKDGIRSLSRLRQDVAHLESVLDRPLVFKNPLLSLHVGDISRAFPRAVFVDVQRDPLDVAASLLRSRILDMGDRKAWWSVRPPNMPDIEGWSAERQVAYQIKAIRESIETGLNEVNPNRVVRVIYEELCEAPNKPLQDCAKAVESAGGRLDPIGTLPASFHPRSTFLSLADEEAGLVRKALAQEGLVGSGRE